MEIVLTPLTLNSFALQSPEEGQQRSGFENNVILVLFFQMKNVALLLHYCAILTKTLRITTKHTVKVKSIIQNPNRLHIQVNVLVAGLNWVHLTCFFKVILYFCEQ